ncbi:PREDICTED: proline-rich protein 22, partial [Cariama cristata]|uniref:proline-rich protein 22 n=1 Tax=Cariama cristata TaxID=54380 RepID=UPI000520BBC2
LQRAPCGCCFDPRAFSLQWTIANLPPPAISALAHGPTALPAAALWGPGPPLLWAAPRTLPLWAAPWTLQGQQHHLTPGQQQRRVVDPDPLLLPTSVPGLQHLQGQPAHTNSSGTDTPAGTPPGSDTRPGTDVPLSPSAAPHNPALGDPPGDLALPEEVPLQEALSFFNCCLDEAEVSQEVPGSGPMPGHLADTGAAIPSRDFAWLSLPEEVLSPDYGVPETADAILSLAEAVMGLEAQNS